MTGAKGLCKHLAGRSEQACPCKCQWTASSHFSPECDSRACASMYCRSWLPLALRILASALPTDLPKLIAASCLAARSLKSHPHNTCNMHGRFCIGSVVHCALHLQKMGLAGLDSQPIFIHFCVTKAGCVSGDKLFASVISWKGVCLATWPLKPPGNQLSSFEMRMTQVPACSVLHPTRKPVKD